MLSSIPAQLTDLPAPGREPASGAAFGLATGGELVTFAELLRQPAAPRGPWPPAIGTDAAVPALPPGGKPLPARPESITSRGEPPLVLPEAAVAEGDVLPVPAVDPALPEGAITVVPPPATDNRDDSPLVSREPAPAAADAGSKAALPLEAPVLSADRFAREAGPLPGSREPLQAARAPAVVTANVPEATVPDVAELSEAPIVKADAVVVPEQAFATRKPVAPVEAMLAALGRDASAAAAGERFDHAPAAMPLQPNTAAAPPGPGAAAQPTQPFTYTSVAVPMGEPAWADAFGDQVVVLAGKQVQRAEIRLHPAELGPVQIRITVEEDGTTLAFTAQHAATRDAIEQALPRLRELFSDQGLSLLDTSVSEHGRREERETQFARGEPQRTTDTADDIDTSAPERTTLAPRRGLVDTFA